MSATASNTGLPVWFNDEDIDVEEFIRLTARTTSAGDYPLADGIISNVVIYDSRKLVEYVRTDQARKEAQAELVKVFGSGPGIAVFKNAYGDLEAFRRATETFESMVADQKAAGVESGDHFAKPGANDRVWGLQTKFARRNPKAYVAYYSNPIIELAAAAWLGPMYQVTADLNVVNPGGEAQRPHRDYHLGFMSRKTAAEFPSHAHLLSPVLTLQGAVAHCDMPVETGPTLYLPYSHLYPQGYIAAGHPEIQEYFADNYVQLPLEEGDVVFFNPALYHGAGTNRSASTRRMANLLQISSAFGRALGTVDREGICVSIYPDLLELSAEGRMEDVRRVIAASAEGYAFPTNLDRDQPIGGLSPETQAELLERAVRERMAPEELQTALRNQAERHQA